MSDFCSTFAAEIEKYGTVSVHKDIYFSNDAY